jgi:hypothetical protein
MFSAVSEHVGFTSPTGISVADLQSDSPDFYRMSPLLGHIRSEFEAAKVNQESANAALRETSAQLKANNTQLAKECAAVT